MPKVEDVFSQLNGAKYFSSLYLLAGYQYIPLDEASIPKTVLTSPFGKYKYIKVPFGLAQAPAYFQELMIVILKDFNFAIDNFVNDNLTETNHRSGKLDMLSQHTLQNLNCIRQAAKAQNSGQADTAK